MSVRVLLADDQDLIRVGLRLLLDTQDGIDVVGEAADGAEAVELAARLRPDVVVMDIRMPVLDGIAATEQITTTSGELAPRVLVLTTFDLDQYVYGALLAALTPREHEVLVLVAQGLSNTEIAAELVVTEATVKSHLGRVLTKLAARDRAQLVVFAYTNGVVR